MSCFVIGFPWLGTIEYPQAPFAVLRFPLLGIAEYPQAPLAPSGLVGIFMPFPLFQQDKLT
jgi:hypothetical protein